MNTATYETVSLETLRPLDHMIQEAHSILDEAIEEHQPSHIFSLFSGGNDSSVLGHVMRERSDALAHIDTGTALPGVRDFVHSWAERYDVALKVYEAGDAFRRMVLGTDEFWERFEVIKARYRRRHGVTHISLQDFITLERLKPGKGVAPQSPLGFPGPAGHRFAYTRLKERQIDTLVREHKTHARDRIMLLTGGRQAESQRRMGNFQGAIQRRGAKVWVAPIVHWTNDHMLEYRRRFELPQSDVAALIHRSGECNCGAFAKAGERADLALFYPEWEAEVFELEAEARRRGIPWAKWGPKAPDPSLPAAGPMCSDCTAA